MKLDKHRLCTTSLFYLIRTTPHLHRQYASVTLKDTDRRGDILPWPKRRQIASFQGLWGYNTAELEGGKNLLLSLSSSSRGFWLCCCCCSVKTSQQSSTDLHCPVVITQLVCECARVCDRVCVCVCEGFPGLKGSIETSSPPLLSLPCRGDQLPTLGCDGWNIYHSVYRACPDSKTMSPDPSSPPLYLKTSPPTPSALTPWCQSSLSSSSIIHLLAVTL